MSKLSNEEFQAYLKQIRELAEGPLEEIQNRLTAVVAAVIFAISPQKTGTDCDFHKYSPLLKAIQLLLQCVEE